KDLTQTNVDFVRNRHGIQKPDSEITQEFSLRDAAETAAALAKSCAEVLPSVMEFGLAAKSDRGVIARFEGLPEKLAEMQATLGRFQRQLGRSLQVAAVPEC